MLLIWSCRGDKTADWFIERYLASAKLEWVRLNSDMFPEAYRLHADVERVTLRGQDGQTLFEVRDVSSVWYRRDLPSVFDTLSLSPQALEYSRSEAQTAFISVREALSHAKWLNKPEENRIASDKLSQLRDAKSRGFRIPETLITNDALEAAGFAEKHGGKVIAKALRRGTLEEGRVFYSSLIDVAALQDNSTSIAVAPLIFQEPIRKEFEVRAVVIDDACFGVKIFSQEYEVTSVDWRRSPLLLRHEILELPADVAERCIAMTRSSRLLYSAFDLIVTPEGEYVFLEHNPAGQFAWLEELTGVPIGKKLLETLS